VAYSCEYGDKPAGSGATELVGINVITLLIHSVHDNENIVLLYGIIFNMYCFYCFFYYGSAIFFMI
jgi:hypothetical protein